MFHRAPTRPAGPPARPRPSAADSQLSVGRSVPNGFDLLDMGYNVHEWCSDWYDPAYYAVAPVRDPRGPATGARRASRGGAWAASSAGVPLLHPQRPRLPFATTTTASALSATRCRGGRERHAQFHPPRKETAWTRCASCSAIRAWATLTLIDACAALSPEELRAVCAWGPILARSSICWRRTPAISRRSPAAPGAVRENPPSPSCAPSMAQARVWEELLDRGPDWDVTYRRGGAGRGSARQVLFFLEGDPPRQRPPHARLLRARGRADAIDIDG
ncbi:MAG: SUMF1/EgtB/PvdO family nonheme iron enzyme [Dehalococcoidia bacterium]